jgi:hypothetical protein
MVFNRPLLASASLTLRNSASYDDRVDQERTSNPLRFHLPRYQIEWHGLLLWVALERASSTCGPGEESSERAGRVSI